MTTVVHLTSVHPPKDPRIFVKECRSLAAAGYEVVLIAPDAPSGTVDGVRFVDFPPVDGRLRRVLSSSSRMAAAAQAVDGDVYHVHDPELLPVAHRLARGGATVLYDAHEHLTNAVAGKPYLNKVSAPVVARLVGAYEQLVAKRLSGVVAATPTIAEQFDPGTAVVVANYPITEDWVDPGLLTREAFSRRPLRAVYVGGITEVRGAHEMAAAAAVLRTRGAEIHLAGPVSGVPVPSGPGIVYHGTIPHSDVGELLVSARVGLSILHPNPNYTESLPTKAFEYMAAGMPVVVSSVTATLAEIIEGLDCGLVVPHDDPGRLATAIDELLQDEDRAYEMGRRGREAVDREYSWDPQRTALLDLYERLAPLKR
ncbi:MAG: glycosyltransferase [Microthrixaceae bacterium]